LDSNDIDVNYNTLVFGTSNTVGSQYS